MVHSILEVVFHRSPSGREPVREWLLRLRRDDRKSVGRDIKTVQYGWPAGMPLIRKMAPRLWEVRSQMTDGAARVLFTVDGDVMVLLHAFVKSSRKTPADELATARRRLAELERSQ